MLPLQQETVQVAGPHSTGSSADKLGNKNIKINQASCKSK
jgi:hypothetical protein